MRVGNVVTARGAYYDRTPSHLFATYDAGAVAPHALTTRWTITVPSNKKLYLGEVWIQAVRDAVAAPVGQYTIYIEYGCAGSANAGPIAQLILYVNAVGGGDKAVVADGGVYAAGDTLTAKSFDLSTGGSVRYQATAKYLTFDA